MVKKIIIIKTLLLGVVSYAQQGVFANIGEVYVSPNTLVSVHNEFVNTPQGDITNDGNVYFFHHFTNNGLFTFSNEKRSGFVSFQGKTTEPQQIFGQMPVRLNRAEFLKERGAGLHSFLVHNILHIASQSDFNDGILRVDKEQGGAFIFLNEATHIGTADRSHIDGEVIKEGEQGFVFPVGKGGYYRSVHISAPENAQIRYDAEYFLENSDTPERPHSVRSSSLKFIDDKEYWTLLPESDSEVFVTLTWDERTTPDVLYANEAKGLRIVLWDAKTKKWIDQGGIVDVTQRTITTPVKMKKYGYFTLGVLKDELLDDVIVYNGVSNNGDGQNENFFVDAPFFKYKKMKVFNRWGRLVFESDNYGDYENWFNGYSQDNLTYRPTEKLPEGVYYYIFEYRKDEKSELRTKTGWLVLKHDNF